MSDIDMYKNALASNRRALGLLDTQIAQLQALANVDAEGPLHVPYFYGAVGEDGNNGIPLFPGPAIRDYVGLIRIQADAPFVWTHTLVAIRFLAPTSNFDSSFMSIWTSGSGAAANPPNVELSFIDQNSGRELIQSKRENFVSRADEHNPGVAGALFDTPGMYTDFGGTGGLVLENSGGNGPQPHELPVDVLLPDSGVVIVHARPSAFDPSNRQPRVFVTLLGYKIFEE